MKKLSSLLLVLLMFPFYLQAQIPRLDPGFNDFNFEDHEVVIKVQTDGKILILENNKITRLEEDGSIDQNFGNSGTVSNIDFGPISPRYEIPSVLSSSNSLNGNVFLQKDGKIVLASSTKLLRLKTDGSIDQDFGVDGYVYFDVPLDYSGMITYEDMPITPFTFADLGFQSDGKIILAGTSTILKEEPVQLTVFQSPWDTFSLLRFNTDGSMDVSFGENGHSMVPIHLPNGKQISGYVTDMEILPDDNILLAGKGFMWGTQVQNIPPGEADPYLAHALARLLPNGTLDVEFNNGETVLLAAMAAGPYGYNESIEVQEDQKIIVTSIWNYEYGGMPKPTEILRLNSDGSLDQSFAQNGTAVLPEVSDMDSNEFLTLLPNGDILFIYNNAAHRVLEDGELDLNFGEGGVFRFPDAFPWGLKVDLQNDRLVVADIRSKILKRYLLYEPEVRQISVIRFSLYNAQTDQELFDLEDRHVVNLQEIGTNEINIRAYTDPEPTGSVRFNLTGAQSFNMIENNSYYALYQNRGEDFFSWKPDLGAYQLTATPYSESGARGEAGTALTINFTIVDEEAPRVAVTRFTLINAQTNQELFDLEDGHVINLQDIGTNEINIRAYTDPEPTGSVRFRMSGVQDYIHIENNSYYALWANNGNNFFSWKPSLGDYHLTATPYEQSNAKGEAGTALTISFSIMTTSEEILRTMHIYPNPGNDILNIPTSSEALTIVILDFTGREVKTKNFNKNLGTGTLSVDVSDLDKKSYIIKIIEGNDVKSLRWVKQ